MNTNRYATDTGGTTARSRGPDALLDWHRRHRIPEWQLRRAQRSIDHYRRMIHLDGAMRAERKASGQQ
jgi:hypothetical protein